MTVGRREGSALAVYSISTMSLGQHSGRDQPGKYLDSLTLSLTHPHSPNHPHSPTHTHTYTLSHPLGE